LFLLTIRAVPSTRVARACSSSKKLELYFGARVLDNFLNKKQLISTPFTNKQLPFYLQCLVVDFSFVLI